MQQECGLDTADPEDHPQVQTLTGMCLPPVSASRRGAKAGILELNAGSVQEGSEDSHPRGAGGAVSQPRHRNASQPITREALFKAQLKCAKDCREKKKCANEATSPNSV